MYCAHTGAWYGAARDDRRSRRVRMGRRQGGGQSEEARHRLRSAATVFEDVDLLVNVDPAVPSRFIAVGLSSTARVLVVVHMTRAERTRLISARHATVREESFYGERREG